MKKILIIGGSRFVGPAIIERLLKKDYKIYIFNRGNEYGADIKEDVIKIKGDKENVDDLMKLNEFAPYDLVYDMSTYNLIQQGYLISILKDIAKHIVFFSSAAVYLPQFKKQLSENDRRGKNPSFGDYGYNKSLCEDEYLKLSELNNFKLTILRPSYILGKNDYFNRIPYFLSRIYKDVPIIVPGKGQTLLQFCFLEDIADLFVKIPLIQKTEQEIVNVGYKQLISIIDLINLCGKYLEKQPKIIFTSDLKFPIKYLDNRFYDDLWPFPALEFILSVDKIERLYNFKEQDLITSIMGLCRDWTECGKKLVPLRSIETELLQEVLNKSD